MWRTKWNILYDNSSFLFLSCMQGGSAIVEYDGISKTSIARVQQRDEKNDNHLAYGIDVINIKPLKGPESSHLKEQEEHFLKTKGKGEVEVEGVFPGRRGLTVTVASCSFYDNLVQVWDAML